MFEEYYLRSNPKLTAFLLLHLMQMRMPIITVKVVAATRTPIIVDSEGMMYIIHTASDPLSVISGVLTDVLTK